MAVALRLLGARVSVAFTVLTLISALWNLGAGRTEDTYYHQLLRLILCVVGFGSIAIYQWLRSRTPKLALILHYAVTMTMVFGVIWFWGLFVELHPDAYRDIFWNFSIIYAGVAAIELTRQYIMQRRTRT